LAHPVHADLILTYKILFAYVDLDVNLFEFFLLCQHADVSLNFISIIQIIVHTRRSSVSALQTFEIHFRVVLISEVSILLNSL